MKALNTLRDVDENLWDDFTDELGIVDAAVFVPRFGQRLGRVEDLEVARDLVGGVAAARNPDAEDGLEAGQNLVLRYFVRGTERSCSN